MSRYIVESSNILASFFAYKPQLGLQERKTFATLIWDGTKMNGTIKMVTNTAIVEDNFKNVLRRVVIKVSFNYGTIDFNDQLPPQSNQDCIILRKIEFILSGI